MAASSPRSLADQLRGWPEERLLRLLRERPDLASPAPADSTQLASRAATRASLLRALDRLSQVELFALDALVILGQTTEDELATILAADPPNVRAAVDRLLDLALAWRGPGGLRALTGVADALRGSASGLRPLASARSDITLDIGSAVELIEQLSPSGQALLEHLDAAGGQGRTESARRGIPPELARTPVEEVLARGLLVEREDGTVLLPGEVGLALRGGRTTRAAVDRCPPLTITHREPALVDRAAAGAAFEAVRRVELLLDRWGVAPPRVLRGGGLAVRDLRNGAAELGVDEPTAGLLVEVAVAAGLAVPGHDEDDQPAWLPTREYDAWAVLPPARAWVVLARAWLGSDRLPGLIGSRDAQGKPVNALAPELVSDLAAETRRMSLDQLAELPPGSVLAAGGSDSLAQRLEWLRPRRPPLRRDLVAWTLREGAVLGVLGLGGLSSFARVLLSGTDEESDAAAAAAVTPLLPRQVDHVLLQADLTAVAPGPLEPDLARQLQLVADVESRGGATVYRFSSGSLRRAFDAGWTAPELHDLLARASRTPVPQALGYLVDDVARTFGTLRLGTAEAFLRADDEALISELLHSPVAGTLGLRRIAPTVLVTDLPAELLLGRLRDAGHAPVVEAADGSLRVARRTAQRARPPRSRRPQGWAETRMEAGLAAAVRAVRAGDRARAGAPAQRERLAPAGALAALRTAAESSGPVLITYVDGHGSRSDRIVEPLRVEGGQLVARDQRSEAVRTFAVHRIVAVSAVPGRS